MAIKEAAAIEAELRHVREAELQQALTKSVPPQPTSTTNTPQKLPSGDVEDQPHRHGSVTREEMGEGEQIPLVC